MAHRCTATPRGSAAVAHRSAAAAHGSAAAAHGSAAVAHMSPGEAHRSAASNTWGPACGLDVAGSLIVRQEKSPDIV